MVTKLDAQVDAQLKLLPSRSQVFVLGLLVLSGLGFFVGCAFLWHEKPSAWVPFLFCVGFLLAGGFAWQRSQGDTDLDGAHPTKLNLAAGTIQLETDSRTLSSREKIQHIGSLISMLGHRDVLPEPDGLVSASGEPLPEQKQEAIARVTAANEEAAHAAVVAAKILCGTDEPSGLFTYGAAPSNIPENPKAVAMNQSVDSQSSPQNGETI
ncbi:MAG: hypothetical protein V4573_09450 [Pseudomonadota bacterium]